MKKKGFTLIELLATIIMLAVIALITTPVVTKIINSSEQKAYETVVTNIEESAYKYSLYNDLGYSELYKSLELADIKDKGYLLDKDIIDPRNKEEMTGCVIYKWSNDDNKYDFLYQEVCNPYELYPKVEINILNDNNQEWVNENIQFELPDVYDSYKYCVSTSECSPSNQYIGTTTITSNGKNIYICVTGYMGDDEGLTSCVGPYNIDTEKPNITINTISTTSSSIVVDADCTDEVSGYKSLQFSLNNGAYQNSAIFENLISGTYTVNVKCTDMALNETVYSVSKSTSNINSPTISQYIQFPLGSYAIRRTMKIEFDGTNVISPEYYFKSTVTADIDVVSTSSGSPIIASCGTGTNPSNCSSSSVTTLVANTWYKTNSATIYLLYKSNGTLYAKTVDIAGNSTIASTYSIVNIDKTLPSVNVAGISVKTDRATIVANCKDLQSGISKYEYSLDGKTWYSNGSVAKYTFTGLEQNTLYTFKVRCTNGSGLTKTADSGYARTAIIDAPTIEQYLQIPSSGDYAQQRVIRITYSGTNIENPKYYFKSTVDAQVSEVSTTIKSSVIAVCGNGTNPTDCTSTSTTSLKAGYWYLAGNTIHDIMFKENGYLYAKTTDDAGNTKSASTYTVANIDTIVPTISVSVSGKVAVLTLTDNIGVVGYGVNYSGNVEPSFVDVSNINSTTVSYTANSGGTYYAWVKDVAGRTANVSFIIDKSEFNYAATESTSTSTYSAKATQTSANYGATGTTSEECDSVSFVASYVSGGKTWYCHYGSKMWSSCSSSNLNACCCVSAQVSSCCANRTTYSCPNGGTLSGTTCIKSVTTYTCPNGGTLSGTTCTVIATDYSCPNGGTLNTSTNMCEF